MNLLKLIFNLLIFPGGIFLVLISLLFSGIDRKLFARMQRRIGPPIFQPFYDFLKLLKKEVIIPKKVIKSVFLGSPIIGIVSLLIIPIFIPNFSKSFISSNGDIIFIIYLITISALTLIISGSSSASTFASIGASREGVLLLSCELPMVISILSVCKFSGEILNLGTTFTLSNIYVAQNLSSSFLFIPALIPAAIAFLMVIPGECGVVPFDIPEGETEICEGPLVEYTGRYLGILKLSQNIKAFIMSSLFVSLFLGGANFKFKFLELGLFLLLTCITMFLSTTLVRAVFGRVKINQALKFYWTIPTLLSLISLILVNIL